MLLLERTRVSSFNIRGKIIHLALRIPIKDFKNLHGQALSIFQEEMRDVTQILIDEMSFIGPRLFIQIDSRLSEAFPKKKSIPFGGKS